MSSPGPNLPLVIQQAGDVSRLNDASLRAGQESQAAAAQEVAAEQVRQREQVSRTEASDGQNRVRADARERRRKDDEQSRRKKKGGQQGRRAKGRDIPPDGPGGVVDVVA